MSSFNLNFILIPCDIFVVNLSKEQPPQREILGTTGQYFDPEDVNELTVLLSKFTDESFRHKVFKDQSIVLKKYSWDIVTAKIINFIKEIA